MAACQRRVYGVWIEVPGYVRVCSAAAGGRSSYGTCVSGGRSCRVSLVAALSREAAAAETPTEAGAQSQRPLGLRLGPAARVPPPQRWEKGFGVRFLGSTKRLLTINVCLRLVCRVLFFCPGGRRPLPPQGFPTPKYLPRPRPPGLFFWGKEPLESIGRDARAEKRVGWLAAARTGSGIRELRGATSAPQLLQSKARFFRT